MDENVNSEGQTKMQTRYNDGISSIPATVSVSCFELPPHLFGQLRQGACLNSPFSLVGQF